MGITTPMDAMPRSRPTREVDLRVYARATACHVRSAVCPTAILQLAEHTAVERLLA